LQSFLGLLEANPDPKNNLDVVIEHRVNRLRHSKANNPFFFYGPVEMVSPPNRQSHGQMIEKGTLNRSSPV
jgi:hypothetical protein